MTRSGSRGASCIRSPLPQTHLAHLQHREVAVKVLPQTVASSPDRFARFEREARTVAGLNHPNIATLHSTEEEDGIRFLSAAAA